MNESNCLFCLESCDNKITYSSCQCTLIAHEACWISYEINKGIIECPICHVKTEISPLQMAMKRNLREKVIVELPRSRETNDGFQKGCICCCLVYFCACGILSAVFG